MSELQAIGELGVDPDEVLATAHVLALPMRVRFRGLTTRELVLFRGPYRWGEIGAFAEYDDAEATRWLASGLEAAFAPPVPVRRTHVAVNATVPAVPAAQVPGIVARFAGATTAKVKVAEPGQTLADDVARVRAVRELIPYVRVDANGGWTVGEALTAIAALTADGPLQYAEQPCRTTAELAQLRERGPGAPIAADESIRRADDPLLAARMGAMDVAVVKVAPLGGVRATLDIARQLSEFGVSVVVSSALDSAVGIAAGLTAAAALPRLDHACGLATGEFFTEDAGPARVIEDGRLAVEPAEPSPEALSRLAAPPERRDWWLARLARCLELSATLER